MILNCIITSIELITVFIISHKLSKTSIRPKIRDFIFIILALTANQLTSDFPLFSWMLGQTICIVYIFCFSEVSNSESIFLAFATLILLVCLQFISAFLLSILVSPSTLYSDYIGIIGNLTSLLLAILIIYFTPVQKIYQNIILAHFVYKILLLYSYVILFVLLLFFKYNIIALYDNVYIILFILLLLMLSNTCILYYDREIRRRNQELAEYQKNLPIYESLIKEIRTNQHEFSNRLQNLERLSDTCKTYEELSTALHKYTNAYQKPLRAYPLLKINMPLLAAALYNQSIRAEESGIIVHFDVASQILHSRVSESHLTDFSNILLQNAIEACKDGDTIYVHIESNDVQTKIEIRNPADHQITLEELNNFFSYGFSTKSKNSKNTTHGLGLYFLKKELDKYHGNIRANCIKYQGSYWIIFSIEI